jgi:hypothetical protein
MVAPHLCLHGGHAQVHFVNLALQNLYAAAACNPCSPVGKLLQTSQPQVAA